MTNVKLLESIIRDKGLKKKYIAEKLGLSAYGLSLKINNKNEFTASEIASMCDILGISSLRDRDKIFFAR